MKKLIVSALLLISFVTLSAQELTPTIVNTNDFRGRVEGGFECKIAKDLNLEAGIEMRLKSDFQTVDRMQTSIGISYEPSKYLTVGADYILINTHEPGYWEKPRHRANVNVEGLLKVGRFDLSLRERVQTTFRTDSVNRFEKMNPEVVLRSRLKAEYKIRHSRWTPYLMFELNNTLNAPSVVHNYKDDPYSTECFVSRYRLGVGAKFRIDRHNRLDFFYYFDYDRGYNIDYKGNKGDLKGYLQENDHRHIFGISYKFKL